MCLAPDRHIRTMGCTRQIEQRVHCHLCLIDVVSIGTLTRTTSLPRVPLTNHPGDHCRQATVRLRQAQFRDFLEHQFLSCARATESTKWRRSIRSARRRWPEGREPLSLGVPSRGFFNKRAWSRTENVLGSVGISMMHRFALTTVPHSLIQACAASRAGNALGATGRERNNLTSDEVKLS